MRPSTISAGRGLVDLIALHVEAGRPIVVEGRHGIGKSECFAAAAAQVGVSYLSLNLAILEPPDFTGMPFLRDGRTHFAPPIILPTEGVGVLLLDELNRAPRQLLAPLFQLLTERRLNGYVLPAGWLPCAAMNSAEDGDYFVAELDPALLARFGRVKVVVDVAEWLHWARAGAASGSPGAIHPAIVDFVESTPGIFDDADSNPRAWSYASTMLRGWEARPVASRSQSLLLCALSGFVGETLAVAFVRTYLGSDKALSPEEIVDHYAEQRRIVARWLERGRVDLVTSSLQSLQRYLSKQSHFDGVVANRNRKRNTELFLADVPTDLKSHLVAWARERKFDALRVA